MDKKDIVEYIRGGTTYHHCIQAFEGFAFGIKKYFGQGINYLASYFEKDTLYWYYDKNDLYQIGKIIINKLLSSKSFENKFFSIWDKKTKLMFDFIDHNNVVEIKSSNNKTLAKIYKKYCELFYEWYSLTMAIDGTDEFLMTDVSKRIKDVLKNKLKEKYTEKEFFRIYNILTSPSQLSYLNDERRLILELVRDVNDGKIKEGSSDFTKRLNKIVNKFWWTELGWPRENIKNQADVLQTFYEIKKTKIDPQLEIKAMEQYAKNIALQKNQLNEKYNFNKDEVLIKLLEISDKLVKYHDLRKEIQMKGNFWNYEVFAEISLRVGLDEQSLDWCNPEEVAACLIDKTLDKDELEQRAKNFIFVYENNNLVKFSGVRAKNEHKKILEAIKQTTGDLQGFAASTGKVAGIAFVAVSSQEALKIKDGEILVTGMTTPDFVPAMKKAAAIVTDEGGITCHAAIISRELKIPCIVGTKYATRLIKTGDKIEVLANHGVVKIIN